MIKIIAKEKKTNHNKFSAFQINKKTLEIYFLEIFLKNKNEDFTFFKTIIFNYFSIN